jgi:site-specific DNA-methyltransferase (adenine-specific)
MATPTPLKPLPGPATLEALAFQFEAKGFGAALAIHADCFDWLRQVPDWSLHAIVTDPPYGVEEYEPSQLDRLHNGNRGGIWRIPPSFDGHDRSPLPRFTALNAKQRSALREFFVEWANQVRRVLRPGGHLFVAGNAFLSQLVWSSIAESRLEFRGEIVRLVRTLRGGDRPKNAHEEFPDVCSMPRGCFEPWALFRAPMPRGAKVSDCLRQFETGGLRRLPNGKPFEDVILTGRTPRGERKVADHPSLKPQSLLRRLVYASLPLGRGVIADPFMGSGSTLAAAKAMGLSCVGTERYEHYFKLACKAIPKLSKVSVDPFQSDTENLELDL